MPLRCVAWRGILTLFEPVLMPITSLAHANGKTSSGPNKVGTTFRSSYDLDGAVMQAGTQVGAALTT